MGLADALKTVSELKEIYKEEAAKIIIDYALRLEGVARHASTHACGVIITKDPLTNNVPLQYASSSDRSIVSQYSLHPVEDLGLLKVDFLGLKNLTIIESAIKIIKNTRGLDISIEKIPLDDQKTFELFQAGETTGVFQFESSGMKRCLKELKPTEFEDIIAMVALYRPGPMEWIPDFVARKHGLKKEAYLHPKLQPILKNTYGVAIYQEQVMQIARDLAGFSPGEADVLRKAMGKKIVDLLAEQKEKFIEGCVKNAIPQELAEKIFSFIEPFAGYGFNRSHAACYALIGYQTAYLKAHWPTEFMAALMTADQQNTDRIAIEIEECRNMGIAIMPPDINESFSSFTVVTSGTKDNIEVGADEDVKTIRFGLRAIKNVGENIAQVVINERKKNGPYTDISDFLGRVTDKDLNKKSLESLIKSGGLDQFNERGKLLHNMDALLNFNKEASRAKSSKQNSLFTDLPELEREKNIKLDEAPAINKKDKLGWEKELLGLYISEHPFNEYKKYLTNITGLKDLKSHLGDELVNIAGVITNIKKIITRKNEPMLFVKIEDAVSNVEILVFPTLLQQTPDLWQDGQVIVTQGKLSDKDQEIKLLANKAAQLNLENVAKILLDFKIAVNLPANNYLKKQVPFGSDNNRSAGLDNKIEATPVTSKTIKPLKLELLGRLNPDKLEELKEMFLNHQGQSKVYLKVNQGRQANIIEFGFRVNKNSYLIKKIGERFKDEIKIVDK